MRVFYRLSDYSVPKLPGMTKQDFVNNFREIFKEFVLIADNCSQETLLWLQKEDILKTEGAWIRQGIAGIVTNLGNAKSFQRVLDMAASLPKDEIIYFVEDDYLHQPIAPKLLEEGVAISDYVTLYDHPDKYGEQYDFGEYGRIHRTRSSHWKTTVSTCLTFGTKAGILKEDMPIWKKWTNGDHPWDHYAFEELRKKNGRKLISSIPGAAVQCDKLFIADISNCIIDCWALEVINKKST